MLLCLLAVSLSRLLACPPASSPRVPNCLHSRGIPVRLASHDRLASDEGVAALAAYLSLAADPECDPAFEAALGLPHHGLGEQLLWLPQCVCGGVWKKEQHLDRR